MQLSARANGRSVISTRSRPVVAPLRALPQRQQASSAQPKDMLPLLTSMTLPLMSTLPAWADEAAPAPPAPFAGFNPLETALLFAPITIYAIFSVYREKINPKATISDLLLIVALVAILGNIASIVIFKVRFF